MISFIKKIVGKCLYGYRYSKETYEKHLRKKGVIIGDGFELFFPRITHIDDLNPHLLVIGNNVAITGPSTILTHDYSVCVTKVYSNGEILGKQKKTVIGDNVFLGWGCCVLPGTEIKNNTIIGAYAVVSGVLEGNSVYAGNPAKRICSIEEYYEKRKIKQLEEAIDIYKCYKQRFNKEPPIEVFHEYFWLFSGGDMILPEKLKNKFYDHGNYEQTCKRYFSNIPRFSSFDQFLEFARKQ